MADVLVNENSLSAIADAIRAAGFTADTFKVAEMAAAIAGLDRLPGLNDNSLTAFDTDSGDIRSNLFYGKGWRSDAPTPRLARVNITSDGAQNGEIFVGENAFRDCGLLTSVAVKPGKKLAVSKYAFSGCRALAAIPPVSRLGERSFERCAALSSIVLDGVDAISQYAFYSSGLAHLDITAAPSGSYCFAACTDLRDVIINLPATLQSGNYAVGDNAFNGCTSLKTVSITSLRASWDDQISSAAFYGCAALESLVTSGIKTIVSGSLNGCTSLATLTIPDVTNLGDLPPAAAPLRHVYAPSCTTFRAMTNTTQHGVTSINLPALTVLSAGSLRNEAQMEAINLPVCTSIGNGTSVAQQTFSGCTNLAVLLPGSTMATLASSANIPATVTFYVNDALYETYLTATNWTAIQAQIHPMSDCPAAILALFEEE